MASDSTMVLKYPLFLLTLCGQNPETNKVKLLILSLLHIVFQGLALSLTVMQFFHINGNIISVAQNCEAFVVFAQTIGKIVINTIKTEDFRKLINDARHFWGTEMSANNIRTKLENTFTRTFMIQKLYLRTAIVTVILAVSISYFTRQLPTGIWNMPDHEVLYKEALILQEILVPMAAVHGVAYDSLFLGFCIHLRTQFKILHDLLKHLSVASHFSTQEENLYIHKLKFYIQYHEFLLRFSKNMRNAYSPVMLVEYSTVLLLYCAEMYILFESNNVFRVLRHSFVMVSILLQLAFYCIPLNYVTDEAVTISQAIFESDWHSKHIPATKTIISFMIQRSQKEITFTAGGLIEMNCRTLINVVKTSWSVCTILRALKNV